MDRHPFSAPTSPPRARPRLRETVLLAGVHALGDLELVALLLETGTARSSVHQIAVALLDQVGGLSGLFTAGPRVLSEVAGVGPAKGIRLAAAMELGRRGLSAAAAERGPTLMSFQQVRAWAEPRLIALEHEELWLLCLDGQNALKSCRRVAVGGLHGCALSARDVLGHALRDNASAVVLVHNHPSGCPEPSTEDVHMTQELGAACKLLGVPLLDHVVVARSGAISMFERGLLV